MLPVYHPDFPDRSDEHWRHVYRFLGLGEFDRANHERGRAHYLGRLRMHQYIKSLRPVSVFAPTDDTHRTEPEN